jgi:hypothetical protein
MRGCKYMPALCVAASVIAPPAAAQAVQLARGYLTPKDIADPAAFSVQRNDSTWLTKLDGALILATSAATLGLPSVTVEDCGAGE